MVYAVKKKKNNQISVVKVEYLFLTLSKRIKKAEII